jgi:uncharacterized RDD family membrane protein YckC
MCKTGVLLVLAAMCAVLPAAAGGGTLDDERVYSSDHYVLSVRLPQGWDLDEGAVLGPDVERLVAARRGEALFSLTVLDLFPRFHAQDRRKWSTRRSMDRALAGHEQEAVNDLAAEMRASGLEPKWDTTTLAGWPAGRLRAIRSTPGGAEERQEVYVVLHNGALFVVLLWMPSEQPGDSETVTAALDSLQIVRQYADTPPTAAHKAMPFAVGALLVALVCLAPWTAFLLAGRHRARRQRASATVPGAPAPVAPLVLIGGASPDLATAGQRLLTFFLDQVVLTPLTLALNWLFGITVAVAAELAGVDAPGERVLNLAAALVGLAALVTYYGCAEGLWGRTVGKLVAGTRAVRADGSPVGFAVACKRSLCRLIPLDSLSFLGRGGPVGWHDRFAGTLVISVRRRKKPAPAEPSGRDATGNSPATSSGT